MPPRVISVRAAAVLLALAAIASTTWLVKSRRAAQRTLPVARGANLALITIDTLRADRLGRGFTPALDRLAREGTAFTNARAAAPLTLPSHVTLMTGVLPPRHGVRENGVNRFRSDRPTLASVLKEAGYRTAAFVGAYVLDRRFGLAHGFDEYDDRIPRDPQAVARLEAERSGEAVASAAIAWIARRTGEPEGPFFVWIHLYDPHAPYSPPPEFLARAGGRPYDAEVAYADVQVARIVSALETAETRRPVVIAAAGDHGESLGEHGERTHGMLIYDGALRVPLVVWARGTVEPARVAAPVSLVDVARSVVRLVGLAVPDRFEGTDLLAPTATADHVTYAETVYPRVAGWSPAYSLASGRWKLVASSESELYDLAADAAERHNLAGSRPDLVRELVARLEKIESRAGHLPASPERLPAEAAARLRSLGYVSAPVGEATRTQPNPARVIGSWVAFEEALGQVSAGAYGRAIPALGSLAEKHPDGAVFQSTYARALRESGNLAEALEVHRRLVSRWPRDATLWHELAVAAREAGLWDEALRAERAALAIDPDDPAAWNGLGLLSIESGDPAEAVTAFDRAVAADPTNASYWTNLGNARRERRDAKGAEDAYRRAIAVDARHADAANGLGVLLVEARRPGDAIPWFERALAAAPDLVEARLNLGIAYQQSGQRDKAANAYRAVLQTPARFGRERAAAAKLLASLR